MPGAGSSPKRTSSKGTGASSFLAQAGGSHHSDSPITPDRCQDPERLGYNMIQTDQPTCPLQRKPQWFLSGSSGRGWRSKGPPLAELRTPPPSFTPAPLSQRVAPRPATLQIQDLLEDCGDTPASRSASALPAPTRSEGEAGQILSCLRVTVFSLEISWLCWGWPGGGRGVCGWVTA